MTIERQSIFEMDLYLLKVTSTHLMNTRMLEEEGSLQNIVPLRKALFYKTLQQQGYSFVYSTRR